MLSPSSESSAAVPVPTAISQLEDANWSESSSIRYYSDYKFTDLTLTRYRQYNLERILEIYREIL